MCLTLVEILFLISGLYLIFSGKIPTGLFKVLFGKGEYALTSNQARLFGVLLAAPMPLSFVVGVIIALLFGSEGLESIVFFETLIVIGVSIVAIIIARRIKKPLSEDVFSGE